MRTGISIAALTFALATGCAQTAGDAGDAGAANTSPAAGVAAAQSTDKFAAELNERLAPAVARAAYDAHAARPKLRARDD